MKIHVIGESGSGKTTFAKKFALQHNMPLLELDDIFWNNDVKGYGLKRSPEERSALLNEFIKHPDYVIEGIYFSWLHQSFENADKIYVMDINIHIRNFRILKRFFFRKLGILKSKDETFKSVFDLIKWNFSNLKIGLNQVSILKEKYGDKVIILKNNKDIKNIFQ